MTAAPDIHPGVLHLAGDAGHADPLADLVAEAGFKTEIVHLVDKRADIQPIPLGGSRFECLYPAMNRDTCCASTRANC